MIRQEWFGEIDFVIKFKISISNDEKCVTSSIRIKFGIFLFISPDESLNAFESNKFKKSCFISILLLIQE